MHKQSELNTELQEEEKETKYAGCRFHYRISADALLLF